MKERKMIRKIAAGVMVIMTMTSGMAEGVEVVEVPTEVPVVEQTMAPTPEATEVPLPVETEAPTAEPTLAPTEMPVPVETSAPEQAPSETQEEEAAAQTEAPTQEEIIAEPTAEAEFAEGYVRLKKDAVVYKEAKKGEALGKLLSGGIAYAKMAEKKDEVSESWLKLVFDTEELRESDAGFMEGYVQYKDVEILTEDETAEMVKALAEDEKTRLQGNDYVPCARFEKEEEPTLSEEEAEQTNMQMVVKEEDAAPAEVPSETAAAQKTEIIGVWYDKGVEGRPLQIHVTTSLDAQNLNLYQGDQLLASWKASESNIVEYPACKEWHVSYTFAYSGMYLLWYQASRDEAAVSEAFTPDPVEIERPAVIEVWYERGVEKEPLKMHVTTSLKMQHLYLYLGDEILKSWSASEAEIVEYATCKEWIVDYTFGDPGAYFLWFKASADGTEMSLPYSPAAAQIERPAVIEVWYEKGLEGMPLKIHATTNLDMQHLYLYLGDNLLGEWNAAETEIVEYSTCKEWIIEYTFADPGYYCLWYKASKDGVEMSQAYAPAPANVERPAVIEVWYEEAAAGTPLRMHITTNLDMQQVYMYLGETELANWNAADANITEYATCKEWTVEHTFNDPGAYCLWYKASKDGETMEIPFAPDPAYIGEAANELPAPIWESVEQADMAAVLKWQAVDGAHGYEVSMSESEAGEYTVIGEEIAETTLTTEALAAGKTYYFKVRAYEVVDGVKKLSSQYSDVREIMIAEMELAYGDFTYKYNEGKDGVIIVRYNGSDANVIVPDVIDGLPVVEIGDRAFEGNATLCAVSLPDTVECIGIRAFAECTQLREMD